MLQLLMVHQQEKSLVLIGSFHVPPPRVTHQVETGFGHIDGMLMPSGVQRLGQRLPPLIMHVHFAACTESHNRRPHSMAGADCERPVETRNGPHIPCLPKGTAAL